MLLTTLVNRLFRVGRQGFRPDPTFTGYGISPQPPTGAAPWLLGLGVAAGVLLLAAIGAPSAAAHPDREIALLRNLAENGDAGAQLQLGLAYQEGRYGLAPDPKAGLDWLARAADSGQSYAADLVGTAYADGRGTTPDPAAAHRWWTLAARAGNAHAALRLGEQLAATAPRQAERWLDQAAAQGNRQAARDLRTLYRRQGAPANDRQPGTRPLDVIAARTHSPTLQAVAGAWDLLTRSTAAGQRTKPLLRRARAGDPTAEFQLGLRYRDGAWGVARDPAQAAYWLQRAATDGNRLARRALKENHASRSPQQPLES